MAGMPNHLAILLAIAASKTKLAAAIIPSSSSCTSLKLVRCAPGDTVVAEAQLLMTASFYLPREWVAFRRDSRGRSAEGVGCNSGVSGEEVGV